MWKQAVGKRRMQRSRVRPGAAASAIALAIALAAASGAAARAEPPASVTIPFRSAAGAPVVTLTQSPHVPISVNGGRRAWATVDTGSTGLVATEDNFPLSANAVRQEAGEITYSSSNVTEYGTYYLTDVVIGEAGATATTHVPVLRVDRVRRCRKPGADCITDHNPRGVAYMGVGFARGGAQAAAHATAAANPFLNVTAIDGTPATPVRGYIMQPTGVTLGLTQDATRGFTALKLAWDSATQDWGAAGLTLTVTPPDGQDVTGTGTVLTDTGIPYMFLRPGGAVAQAPGCTTCLAAGTRVSIAIGAAASPALRYSVSVNAAGDITAEPAAAVPAGIHLLRPASTAHPVFVNTGFHFLNAFSYFYDYASGSVGYRKN